MATVAFPKYSQKAIHDIADEFRIKYCGEFVPVDIHKAVEFTLHWEVAPIKDLYLLTGFEAFINSQFTIIFVDSDRFLDDRSLNRMRFSLAHEAGHFALHSDFYKGQNIKTVADFIEFYKTISPNEYDAMEKEADEFAGRLLVPYERLHSSLEKAKEKMSGLKNLNTTQSIIASYVAIDICKDFLVSQDVIEIRLKKESCDLNSRNYSQELTPP